MASKYPWGNVSLACHFDSSMVDDSNYQHSLTLFNNADLVGSSARFGATSLFFDGGGDYAVAGAHSPAFDFGSGDFTIECWVRAATRPTIANKFAFLVTADNIGVSRGWALFLGDTNGYLSFSQWANNSTVITIADTVSFPLNQWVHVAVCRSGTTLRLFRDGVVVATNSSAGAAVQSSNSALVLGSSRSSNAIEVTGAWNYNGYLDDLIIAKGHAQYTTAFAPSDRPFYRGQISGTVKDSSGSFARRIVRAHRRTDGKVVDETLSNAATGAFTLNTPDNTKHYAVVHDSDAWITYLPMNGTNNATVFDEWSGKTVIPYGNAKISTAQSKFGGASALFDGSGDYLTIPAAKDIEFGAYDFTTELWVRPGAIGAVQVLVDYRSAAGVGSDGYMLQLTAAGALRAVAGDGNTSALEVDITSSVTLVAGTWYHVAFVRLGSSFKLYIDGVERAAATASFSLANGSVFFVGVNLLGSNYFNGYIDDLRISKGVARYSTNFTPPATPLGDSLTPANAMVYDMLTPA